MFQSGLNKIGKKVWRASYGEDEKININIVVSIAVIVGIAAVLWGASYWFLDLKQSAFFPLSFSLITFVSLAIFVKTKRYRIFKFIQLFILLLTPFFLQFSLGGFNGGSVVMIWAFLAPVGALILSGKQESLKWLAAYLVFLIAGSFLESNGMLPFSNTTTEIKIIYYVFNIATVSSITYGILNYFITESEKQKHRSEQLLLNVLPASIAEKLKYELGVIAESYEHATVLFADLVGFTSLTEKMSPDEMIHLLNRVFSYFDSLSDQYGLEKIRTIGDNYMVASGVPTPREDHAHAMALMALDIIEYTKNISVKWGEQIEFRVGFNSGAMTGGVIGQTKFHFDVWGDVVNTASRMESQSVPGKIQVTANTYELLKNDFNFEKRGNISVKGKGDMETYFLISKK